MLFSLISRLLLLALLVCCLLAPDLFALFADTLLTLSHLSPSDLQAPHATLLSLIKPHSRFPDAFIGLYLAPAAAVNLLVLMLQHYPYTAVGVGASHARVFLSSHVFPFFLSLFSLRLPDNLLTKLLGGLNSMLERHVAWSALELFREFNYKFLYAMMAPGAWPKSATVKNVREKRTTSAQELGLCKQTAQHRTIAQSHDAALALALAPTPTPTPQHSARSFFFFPLCRSWCASAISFSECPINCRPMLRCGLWKVRAENTEGWAQRVQAEKGPAHPFCFPLFLLYVAHIFVAELDSAHPLYRLLYRELDSDQLFTLSGVPEHADSLQLDGPTHSFLCLCSHVFYHALIKPDSNRSKEEEESQIASDAAAAASAASVAAGASTSAIAASADSSTASSARKRRRLENDAAFSAQRLWDQFSAATGLPSSKLVSWLKFLYVFVYQYPSFLQLHTPQAPHSPAALLAQLLHGLIRSSERTKAEVKLWSLVCLSRLASVCHINGVQLMHPPSPSFLLTFPSHLRESVSSGYANASALFGQVADLLLKKHLVDERRLISRCALSLFSKLACYNLLSASHLAHLQTVFAELPALKQASAPSSSLRLSSQLMIKKETMMSPQPKAAAASLLSQRGGVSVKLEGMNGAGVGASAAVPMQSMLSTECDGVTLRFLVAYLQRFDLQSSAAAAAAAMQSPTSASPLGRLRSGGGAPTPPADSLTDDDLLRWILSYRFGSSQFSPSMHSLRGLWSTSQWVATAVAALNHLPLCAGQRGVCLEDEHAEEVRLPAPQSRFVHAARPHFTWLKADALGVAVDVHNPAALRDYCIESQFAPLVSTETTQEEVETHQLPSVGCKQHHTKQNAAAAPNDAPQLAAASSASAARSSSLRLQTLAVLSEHVASLQRHVSARANRNTIDMDTTDHHRLSLNDEPEYKSIGAAVSSSSSSGVDSGLRIEDVNFGVRFYVHYVHIMCAFMQREATVVRDDAQQQQAFQESRITLLDLLSTCLKQMAQLLPHLLSHIDSLASANLFAYVAHILSHFEAELVSTHLASGEKRAISSLQQGFGQLQAAVLKVLLYAVKETKSNGGKNTKRSLGFDDIGGSRAPSSTHSSFLASDLYAESLPAGVTPVFDSLISIVTRLLCWRVLAPVNLLSDLKQQLDNHMGLKQSVRDNPIFYRLAHVHALAKSVSHTPDPNADLLYYVSFMAEEFAQRAPEGSTITALSKDSIHYRALCFFLDLAASIRGGWITLEGDKEVDRMHKVWERVFAVLNATKVSTPLHRYSRLLKARCAYAGVMSGLTNNWSLVSHLSFDLAYNDFVVRLFAATQVRLVLTIPEAAAAIYPSFEKRILAAMAEDKDKKAAANAAAAASKAAGAPPSDSLDKRESMLITLLSCLAQMSISVEGKERTILLHMCHLWRERPSARPIIALVYQQLSSCLHYQQRPLTSSSSLQTAQLRARSSSLFPPSSSTSLLDDHLDFVLNEWLQEKLDIAEFPRELLMQGGGDIVSSTSYSLDAFLRQYANRICAMLVILQNDTMDATFKLLLDAVGCDLATLLKKYFPICCARFYAIYSQNTSDNSELVQFYINAATGCLEFLKKAMGERKFNAYYHSSLSASLCALVDLVVMDPSGSKLASYSLPNFITSLTQLAKAEKLDVAHHLCSPVHDRIQTLLLYLRVRIASEFRAFRQWKLFELVRSLLLECIGEFMCAPAVWRPIVDLLLWMLPEFDARVRSTQTRDKQKWGEARNQLLTFSFSFYFVCRFLFSSRVMRKSVLVF